MWLWNHCLTNVFLIDYWMKHCSRQIDWSYTLALEHGPILVKRASKALWFLFLLKKNHVWARRELTRLLTTTARSYLQNLGTKAYFPDPISPHANLLVTWKINGRLGCTSDTRRPVFSWMIPGESPEPDHSFSIPLGRRRSGPRGSSPDTSFNPEAQALTRPESLNFSARIKTQTHKQLVPKW